MKILNDIKEKKSKFIAYYSAYLLRYKQRFIEKVFSLVHDLYTNVQTFNVLHFTACCTRPVIAFCANTELKFKVRM